MSEKETLLGQHEEETSTENTPKVRKAKPARAPKVKKEKTPKPPKVKKVKSPKPPKEKKAKTPKPPRVKKEKPAKSKRPPRLSRAERKTIKQQGASTTVSNEQAENKPVKNKKTNNGILPKIGSLLLVIKNGVLTLWKWIRKLKIFAPQKIDPNAPLLTGDYKVQPQFCIQTKLLGCFLIPVVLIIVLGITSYIRASDALVTNYESAVAQSMSMTKEYFNFVFTNIESDINVYLSDEDLNNYYSGSYDISDAVKKSLKETQKKATQSRENLEKYQNQKGSVPYLKAYYKDAEAKSSYTSVKNGVDDNTEKENNIYQSMNKTLSNKVATNNFISNIYIVKSGRHNMSSVVDLRYVEQTDTQIADAKKNGTEIYKEADLYKAFSETDYGKATIDGMMEFHWNGPQPKLDDMFKTDSESYILRVSHALTETSDGVIIIDLRRDTVNGILKSLNLGEGSFVGIISPDGQELVTKGKALDSEASKDDSSSSSSTDNVKEKIYSNQDFYKKAVASKEDTGNSYVSYNGSKYLFTYDKLGSDNMMLCSLIPKSVIVADANAIRTFTIFVVLFAVLISSLVGTLISRGFSKTINKTIRQLEKVAQGDLTVPFRTARRDEFAQLYGSCNDMIGSVRSLLLEVESVYNSLSISSDKVDGSSTTFSKTTKDIQTSVHEIEIGITQQSDDAADCLTQMDNLFSKINVVNEKTSEISTITTSTKDAIEVGIGNMENLNERTSSTSKITDNIIRTIEDLSVRSKNIGQIVNTINDIAEETNLLSLNASIEAARAGVAGKGFAVVADEIRKLADQCLMSANKISDIVAEITTTTTQAVETAQEAEDIVHEQVLAVQTTSQSFAEMNAHVAKLANHLDIIEESSANMEKAGSQTLNSMESISSILEETSAAISSVTSVVDMQTTTLSKLDEASSELTERANNLGIALAQFKTK